MKDFITYLKALWHHWKTLMSGIAAFFAWAVSAWIDPIPLPVRWSFFTFGIGSFFWASFLAWREQFEMNEKEKEQREKIKATLSFGVNSGGSYLQVLILNQRDFVIPIKSVKLVMLPSNEHQQSNDSPRHAQTTLPFVHFNTLNLSTAGWEGSVTVPTGSVNAVDLEGWKDTTFRLLFPPESICQEILSLSPENVWISISSPSGELARIDGTKIQANLDPSAQTKEPNTAAS